jgi:hypothetical protein
MRSGNSSHDWVRALSKRQLRELVHELLAHAENTRRNPDAFQSYFWSAISDWKLATVSDDIVYRISRAFRDAYEQVLVLPLSYHPWRAARRRFWKWLLDLSVRKIEEGARRRN